MDVSVGSAGFYWTLEVIALLVVLILIGVPLKIIYRLGDVTQAELEAGQR